jgi:hypothetical protein
MELYYSPADRRIHLRGSDEGWLKADYNFDGNVDFQFSYSDADRDGIIDTWKTDVDGDGVYERTVQSRARAKPVPLRYRRLSAQYTQLLADAVEQNQVVISAMKAVLQKREARFREDDVERYFRDELSRYRSAEGVGRRIRDSAEGTRYYGDLMRERYFVRLQAALAMEGPLFRGMQQVYDRGDYRGLAQLLRDRRVGW